MGNGKCENGAFVAIMSMHELDTRSEFEMSPKSTKKRRPEKRRKLQAENGKTCVRANADAAKILQPRELKLRS